MSHSLVCVPVASSEMSCLMEALQDKRVRLQPECKKRLQDRIDMWSYAAKVHEPFTLSVETLWTLWKHSWRWCDREETHWALHTTEPTQPLTSTCRRVLQVTSWGGRTCFLKMLLNFNKHHWTVNNWFIHVFFKTIYSQWVRVVSMSSNNDKTLTSKSVFFSLLKKSFHRFYLLIKNLFLKSSLNLFYF